MTHPNTPLEPGTLLGQRYRLHEVLGRGGMATVYRAVDEVLGREVAVKVMGLSREDAEVAAERFRREGRATAALNHPHIVTVFDAGLDADHAYIVMELLPGPTLADEVKRDGRFAVDDVARIARQLADALAAAHGAGIIHRDIKPGNVARTPSGEVKLLDFGITQITDETLSASHSPLTLTGTIIGTSTYLAPEQAAGGPVDHRADLYALGCVLYTLLTGGPPYRGDTTVATLMAHVNDPVPDVLAARPDTPPELATVVTSLLAKDPADRPPSAASVGAALGATTQADATRLLELPAATAVATMHLPIADEPTRAVAVAGDDTDETTGLWFLREGTNPGSKPRQASDDPRRRVPAWLPLVALAAVAVIVIGALLLNRPDTEAGPSPSPTDSLGGAVTVDPGPGAAGPSPTAGQSAPPASPAPTSAPPVTATSAATSTSVAEPTLAPPPPQPTTQPPRTTAPAPSPPPASAPAPGGSASAAAQDAADRLSGAVRDATTGGTFDKDARKRVEEGLRGVAAALRDGSDQQASDALSAVDQALSDSGQKAQFEALYTSLKDAIDRWKGSL